MNGPNGGGGKGERQGNVPGDVVGKRTPPKRRLRVGFVHPNLGLGGAERLVVDAAVGLSALGHDVEVFTAYHSPTHCFAETIDGTVKVTVWFGWIPAHVAHRGHVLFAHLRMLLITLRLLLWPPGPPFDCFFVDQVASPLVLLWLWGRPSLFYCHFPDKLCDSTLVLPTA
eukprot:RCo030646